MLSGTPARPGSKDNVSDVSDYLTESCSQWFQPLMPPSPQLCCDKGQALGAAKSLHVNAPGPVTSEPKCSPLASQREEIPSFFPYFTKGVAVSLSSSLPLSVFLNITLHMESALGEEKL